MRAEWALVDEILTSENRNPLRALQKGPTPPPSLCLEGKTEGEKEYTARIRENRDGRREMAYTFDGSPSLSYFSHRVAFNTNLKGVGLG